MDQSVPTRDFIERAKAVLDELGHLLSPNSTAASDGITVQVVEETFRRWSGRLSRIHQSIDRDEWFIVLCSYLIPKLPIDLSHVEKPTRYFRAVLYSCLGDALRDFVRGAYDHKSRTTIRPDGEQVDLAFEATAEDVGQFPRIDLELCVIAQLKHFPEPAQSVLHAIYIQRRKQTAIAKSFALPEFAVTRMKQRYAPHLQRLVREHCLGEADD